MYKAPKNDFANNVKLHYEPTVKQELLHNSVFQQCLYGGSAGGGKSRALRWDLIQWCLTVPGIETFLFRKTFSQLDDNHVRPIQREVPQSIAQYNIAKNRFEFYNGSAIYLSHCENTHDYLKYQGAEFHVLAIDEASLFEPIQIIELRSRVRLGSFQSKVPKEYREYLPRFICSSNPGGPSHNFLKRTFIDPSSPYKLFHDTTLKNPNNPDDKGWSTIYIKAKMEDNPHLDYNYASVFSAMSPARANALREGDWSAIEGQAFHLLNEERHKVRSFPVPKHWFKFTSMDWGTAKPFSVGYYCVVGEDTFVKNNKHIRKTTQNPEQILFLPYGSIVRYNELYGWNGRENEGLRLDSLAVAKMIMDLESQDRDNLGNISYRVADTSMFSQYDGPSPAERMMIATKGKIILQKCRKDRFANYNEILSRLAGNPFLLEDGKVHDDPALFITDNCLQAWRTLPVLMLDPIHPDKGWGENQEDHVADELAYGLASRPMITTKQSVEHDELMEARRAVKQGQVDHYSTTRIQ